MSALRPAGSTRAWRVRRAAWVPLVAAGAVLCPRCGLPILRHQAWDLGHQVDRAAGGEDDRLRPEHASCNRSAGGRAGAHTTNRRHNHRAPGW